MDRTRNAAYSYGYPGFESQSLRIKSRTYGFCFFVSRQLFSPRLGSCSTSLRKRRSSTIRLRIPVSPQKSKPFRYLDGFLFCTFYKFTCITRSLSVHLHRVTNNNPNIICYETLLFSAFVKHVLDRASPSATLSESRVEC